ncbi:glycoside hydrolase family 88 protein [Flammeovirgaceae bacterium SG7u.111]|nr:glycoside hydrolase family 88 protein [Flammeovirgaceae bacterium SG7u.132]WPO36297.1 glycoside hydrolase family 88 protein [Flammeovirgaceae bacterium SG7u.111]
MKKHITILFLFITLASCSQKVKETDSQPAVEESQKESPLYVQMADSELKRNPDPRLLDFREKPKWEYSNGLVCSAVWKVWQKTKNQKYYDYVLFYADSMIMDDGKILTYRKLDYNIDRVNPGKFVMEVYKETNKDKYKLAIETLRDQMREHPRTSEGGFWHKKRYPSQMWLDGLYMGSPFLAQYATEFGEHAIYDDVAKQIYLIDKYTWDENVGLYYHGWDESREQKWSNPETGRSPHAWGRAMGWFAMALVDVLDFFPEDHPKRADILSIHKKMADAIIANQDASGLWWQVMDRPGDEGNYLEGSASSMFSYFLLKSANKGYLDGKYLDAGKKGYEAIVSDLIQKNDDGTISLTQVCGVAGLGGNPYRDGSYEYYVNEIIRDNDPKGVGPFIMASLEFEKAEKSDL